MGDDWADEEVPMDNIEQVFIKHSWMTLTKILGAYVKYAHRQLYLSQQPWWQSCQRLSSLESGPVRMCRWTIFAPTQIKQRTKNYMIRCRTCLCKTTSLWRRSTPSTSLTLLEGQFNLLLLFHVPDTFFSPKFFLHFSWEFDQQMIKSLEPMQYVWMKATVCLQHFAFEVKLSIF